MICPDWPPGAHSVRINSLRDTVHVDNRAATIRKPIAVDVITFLLADDIETLSLSLSWLRPATLARSCRLMISTPHVAKWIYKRQLERERERRRERVKLLLIKTGRHGTRGGSSDIIRNFRRNIRRNHPDLQAALREIVAGIVYKGKSGGEDVSIANSHLNFQKDLALALLGGADGTISSPRRHAFRLIS